MYTYVHMYTGRNAREEHMLVRSSCIHVCEVLADMQFDLCILFTSHALAHLHTARFAALLHPCQGSLRVTCMDRESLGPLYRHVVEGT